MGNDIETDRDVLDIVELRATGDPTADEESIARLLVKCSDYQSGYRNMKKVLDNARSDLAAARERIGRLEGALKKIIESATKDYGGDWERAHANLTMDIIMAVPPDDPILKESHV